MPRVQFIRPTIYFAPLLQSILGTIPESLGQLSKVTSLNLVNNQLSGESPRRHICNGIIWMLLVQGTTVPRCPYSSKLEPNRVVLSMHNGGPGRLLYRIWLHLSFSRATQSVLPLHFRVGAIPKSLGDLSNLTPISLGNNRLNGEFLCKLISTRWKKTTNGIYASITSPKRNSVTREHPSWRHNEVEYILNPWRSKPRQAETNNSGAISVQPMPYWCP